MRNKLCLHLNFCYNRHIWRLKVFKIMQLLCTTNYVSETACPLVCALAFGHFLYQKTYCFCCDRKARTASAQSFTLWQQATIEITRRDHSINACSRHKFMMVFFAHVPFVANRTFNATLTERLQHFHAVLVSVSKPVDWAY